MTSRVEKKRPNRSDVYQWRICELTFSHEFFSAFTNEDSIYAKLNPLFYSEELLNLKDQLRDRTFLLANQCLTPKQKEIFHLTAQGFTQQEIAKKLDVNQSSITKCLNGNKDYTKGGMTYGGLIKKMKRIVAHDNIIQDLLSKINELS